MYGDDMNNRGFTLIEIIGVIIILTCIFLVGFPTLNNMLNKESTEEYDTMVENLCTAGKTYMYANMDSFKELSNIDSEITLEIEELILYGNVDKNTTNPNTGELVSKDMLKYKVLDDYSLDCEYMKG